MGAWHIANGTIAVARRMRSCGVIVISLLERAYEVVAVAYPSRQPTIIFEH